ncbi:hypothetical protein A1O3_02334 [Capronia epimyces CBS 606.96]|uniref:USP domain-containing protein n=1 Tax=Capronia epimyces CBS 606.96 TaxID=1182542 RepID=W9Y9R0_9EURO|nr:uncharacterized protein A1O3_02334 [Capronia epimyces CBS 606.96]EXJ89268.1 hypothetical protein A1O3_02334 [Capronia epimyces CBS 606.96]
MPSSMTDLSTRNRSDSGESSELPEHEHKRPRLSDTEPDETHIMSDLLHIDTHPAPAASDKDSNGHEEGGHIHNPPLPPRATVPAAAVTAISPTSKVTINTRPLSSQSVTQPTSRNMLSTSPTSEVVSICGDGTQDFKTPTAPNADPQDTISTPSAGSKSPEIEIAEVEDFDQDPAQTRWTGRVGSGARESLPRTIQPGHVYRTFPFAHEMAPGSTHRMVTRMADRFQNAGPQDGDIFRQVRKWMIDFVSTCDKFTASIYDEDREFWQRLPDLVESLLRREAGPPAQARTDDLVDFFVAYGQLTKLLMDYDTLSLRAFSENADPRRLKPLVLVSGTYLQPLVWLSQSRIPFYESLRTTLNFHVLQFLTLLLDRLGDHSAIALLPSISALLSEICAVLPKKPDLFRHVTSLLLLTMHLMGPLARTVTGDVGYDYSAFSHLDYIRDDAAGIILKADDIVQQAIVKQASWLNLETAPKIIEFLSPLMACIAVEVPAIGRDIISSAGVGFADSDLTDLPSTMPHAWKFKTLRKFVTNGRMELRVYGVDVMSNDLIQIYREHILGKPPPPTANPLIRFLVKFIDENQLVDYIVGVDSHPQIIRRAPNIVGFLCVSGTYTESHTDMIWKTIVESQDPNTVHEVFNLLQQCFHVYDIHALYYICRKLLEYPFQRLDIHALNFIITVFDNLKGHLGSAPLQSTIVTTPISRQLCIRLLREASKEENIPLEHAVYIRREFPQQMINLLALGRAEATEATVDEDERTTLFRDAASNIEAHNDESTGDVQVLTCLLKMLTKGTILKLVQKFELSTLLVADFVHLYERYRIASERNEPLSAFEVMYETRSSLLYHLIALAPETFSDDMVGSLWSSLFAAHQLSASIRAGAWETLNFAMRPRQETAFLDLVIDKYLQTLRPQDYSERVLDFIKASVYYTVRRSPQAPQESGDVVIVPGIERLWKVMLEAPPNTVENEATDYIIKQYLDNPLVTRCSKAAVNATHSSLVDRCVQQVIASASKLKSYTDGTMSGEDEPMVIIASEDEIRAEELRFDRSLLFLRKFLEGMKSRPRYSPVPGQHEQGMPEYQDRKGEYVELNVQIYGSKYVSNNMQKLAVGSENTGDELFKYLSNASGFTEFTVYHYGRQIPLKGRSSTIAELKLSRGLLILNKTANSLETVPTRPARATSPVDNKIMHHFDDLYDLLDADERLSREVYSFLSLFSAQNEVVRIVRSRERLPTDLLPPNKPFKLLYCARALRSCIEDESFSSSPETQFLVYSIRTIVAVFPRLDLSNPGDALQVSITHGLIEALLLAFRAKVSPEISREYIEDHKEFAVQMSRLLRFSLRNCTSSTGELSTPAMVKLIMETFIEACLHDERIWDHLGAETTFGDLAMTAFVSDPRVEVRHSLLEVVVGLTGAAGIKLQLKVNNPRAPRSRFPPTTIESCLSHIWEALLAVLPNACQQPERCSEVCETMLSILRRIGKSFSIPSLRRHFDQWSTMLVKHKHVEVVGQPLKDHVVATLTKLLLECSKLLKNANALPSSSLVIDKIISRFLFPPLSEAGLATEDTIMVPVLDITVRENLYSLILALCQDSQDIAVVVTKLSDDLLPDDFFEPLFGHDRQCLRSEVGYAGLRNLSNTCYLNSLFSQLFMNVEFRDFFLIRAGLHDPKQKLVSELSKVFAHMQNSYEKSIDPSGAVEAITTYEGEQIDVSVQMDVDEFFNLLFDRLEGQIDQQARDVFKSMYGGQLVQQVKSKECEHISERLEPFSAVQVEIKGKARLEDSLRAYVEGEVLQGENKYSCTSCGRHVDAVKRACLKDVPDNLIFNLKRFDYDIMNGTRAKINDEFQFPDTLDIAPYTLARLSDDEEPGEPDYFQLTGVIVHSGTADSGHYYSFIRQRPSAKPTHESWVQFNDQDVGVFDPSLMRESCFGGSSDVPFYPMLKFNSAYMLFYQRTSSIQRVEEQYRQHDAVNPIRLPLPPAMEQYIAQQNELFLRSYCAQDGAHAQFIRQLLDRMRAGVDGCSDDHTLESSTIEMALEYVRQISGRWKECPSLEDTIKALIQYSEKCLDCAKTISQWFSRNRILEDVIVRSPYQLVRKSFAHLFYVVFNRLHLAKEMMSTTDEAYAQLAADYSRSLSDCVAQLSHAWDVVTRSGRCWTEYFSILNNIQEFGDDEAMLLLDEDYLEKCLDIIMMHLHNPMEFSISRRLRARYGVYLAARERNRPFNHGVLIMFLVNLLLRVDLHHMPDGNYRVSDKKIGLTPRELDILGIARVPPSLEWLRRLIAGRQDPAAINSLVAYLAGDRSLAGSLSDVLLRGLNDRMINTAIRFLRPVLVFCENCHSENQILDLVQSALDSIATVGVDYAKDYFDFVDALMKVENPYIHASAGFMEEIVLQTVQHWAPIFLLAPSDNRGNIRLATVDMLTRILFNPLHAAEDQDPRVVRALRTVCQELACCSHTFVQGTFLNPRSRDISILQPGQASQLIDVVEHCLNFFDVDNVIQEEKVGEIQTAMAALRAKAESALETLSSAEWQENSSEMAELSGEDYEDALSP